MRVVSKAAQFLQNATALARNCGIILIFGMGARVVFGGEGSNFVNLPRRFGTLYDLFEWHCSDGSWDFSQSVKIWRDLVIKLPPVEALLMKYL